MRCTIQTFLIAQSYSGYSELSISDHNKQMMTLYKETLLYYFRKSIIWTKCYHLLDHNTICGLPCFYFVRKERIDCYPSEHLEVGSWQFHRPKLLSVILTDPTLSKWKRFGFDESFEGKTTSRTFSPKKSSFWSIISFVWSNKNSIW